MFLANSRVRAVRGSSTWPCQVSSPARKPWVICSQNWASDGVIGDQFASGVWLIRSISTPRMPLSALWLADCSFSVHQKTIRRRRVSQEWLRHKLWRRRCCLIVLQRGARIGQLARHAVERMGEDAQFIAADDGLQLAEVALGYGPRTFGQVRERSGDPGPGRWPAPVRRAMWPVGQQLMSGCRSSSVRCANRTRRFVFIADLFNQLRILRQLSGDRLDQL